MSVLAIVIPASVVGSYIIVSAFFFRFPTLLHKRKSNGVKASLIAHRGGAAENIENTIAGFKNALNCGMHMLELDCQLTQDKQVVVSHDNHVIRTTGKDIRIGETNYNDLPPILHNLDVTFCKDVKCTSLSEDCRIPLLSEVFKEFSDVPINLDVKEGSDELIEKTIELIRKYHREDITVLANFGETAIKKCKKLAPEIPTNFTGRSILGLLLCMYSGLLPFVPLRDSFLEIPVGKVLLKTFDLNWPARLLLHLYDLLLIRRCLFRHLQRRGVKIYLWVLNDEHSWKMAHKLGVDGVMTDYPTLLKEFSDLNGLNFGQR